MKKRGDISLSFGMISSILAIIAIMGVAFYAINYFLNLGRCTEIGLFYQDLQEKIDQAWNSEIAKNEFSGNLPTGIKSVCFGDLSSPGNGIASQEYNDLKIYGIYGGNTFIYPSAKACDLPYKKINHVDFSELPGFTCFPINDGVVNIRFEKNSYDSLVKIIK